MARNQDLHGKNVFIMKCQTGNNSDGWDTRGFILLQTKNPNILAPSRPSSSLGMRSLSGHSTGSCSSFLLSFHGRWGFSVKFPFRFLLPCGQWLKSSIWAQPTRLQATADSNYVPTGNLLQQWPTPATATSPRKLGRKQPWKHTGQHQGANPNLKPRERHQASAAWHWRRHKENKPDLFAWFLARKKKK